MSASPAVRPLRVLHVVRQFHPNRGGLEDFVANLARAQVAEGLDVSVLTLDRLFARPDEKLPGEDHLGPIAIRRIPYWGSSRYPIAPGFPSAVAKADLVHVHAIDFFFDALAATKPVHRTPLVATTHGGFFHSGAYSGLKQLWFNGPTRLSSLAYRRIVACSPQDAARFAPIAGKRLTLIENGVDIDKFRGAASPRKVKHLVTIGRLAVNKRPERLLAAMAELVRRDPEWQLSVVGTASDWSAERFMAEVARLGLDDHVTLHLGVPDAEVRAVIGRASLFVSASDFEGFGIALVEAASAGLGLVVHANTAFSDLAARHAGIGLIDFTDPGRAATGIAAAFIQLPEHPGAPDWVDDYAWASVAARYADIYRVALGQPLADVPDFLDEASASVKHQKRPSPLLGIHPK
ncbi:glycosyltransferase family 4 protein [Mesorhizobium sp. BR1-1-16]|uniref:glycosyltransferase family 4 protein n=1 Tax=Mesorhizobium sp. BR1-1-16 TaxID=2876653 RepID=UPI001CCC6CD6|nr:glycosyltransferase family 4 protein [Mesorhizobium sp. BR1-1-16]MBZ9936163.1 glycosyltransferase family 4 protein [Mesorhizobium sp. BR1-1-16]